MKKILLSITVCLSLLVVFCGSKNPTNKTTDLWAPLASTDFFTYAQLNSAVANGYFTAVTTVPINNRFVTRDSLAMYLCLGSNTYYSSLVYGQYCSKRCVTAGTPLTHSGQMYYHTDYDIYWGFTTTDSACNHHGSTYTTVYWSGTFGNGTALYNDLCGQNAVNAYSGVYFYMSGQYFTLNTQNIVAGLTNCSGGLTDTYLHISSTSGTTTPSCVVSVYSDAGNTTSTNIANASGGYITVQVTFSDQYGDTQTASGTISNGSSSVSITGSAFGGGGTLSSVSITGITGTSTSQNYISN